MSSLVCAARETPAKQKNLQRLLFFTKSLSLTPQNHSATANEVHCVSFSPHWCDRAFILRYAQVRLSAATPKINGTKGALRRSQNVIEPNEPGVLLLSVIQNHVLQCCEPRKQNADTFTFWNKALHSFPHPAACWEHKFKPNVPQCCFVSCLEVVHKLSEKKGQAANALGSQCHWEGFDMLCLWWVQYAHPVKRPRSLPTKPAKMRWDVPNTSPYVKTNTKSEKAGN